MSARTCRSRLLLFLAVLLIGCAGRTPLRPEADNSAGDVPADSSKDRILVIFADASLARVPVAPGGNLYRQRAAYHSSTWSARVSARIASDYRLLEVDAWPISELGVHCVVFETGRDRSVDKVMQRLSRDTRIQSVQPMHRFRVLNDPYNNLQSGFRLMQVDKAHRWSTGRDVTIAMIDTGVDVDHPDLRGQVVEYWDLVDGSPGHDHDIHGTALAGVIGAIAGNGEGIVGVAPDSKLMVLRACWPEKRNAPAAVCDTLTLAKALNRAISLMPDVVNLSLTGPYDPLLIQLVREAIERGIVVVASDPGGSEDPQNRVFPASVDGVISVHAAAAHPPDNPACFEPNGAQLCAPSADVLTTFPHAAYNFLSGSSVAAAHVSGVIALLLELNPTLTVNEVNKVLRPIAQDVAPHLVNACTVIEKLRSVNCSNAPAVDPEPSAFPSKVSFSYAP